MPPQSGGVASCTYELVIQLNRLVKCDLLAIERDDNFEVDDFIHYIPNDSISQCRYSRNWKRYCRSFGKDEYDVFYVNGLWQYPAVEVCRTAMRLGKPYVISAAHGMLYSEALAHHRMMKCLMLKLIFGKFIRGANCIHATCVPKREVYRDLGFRNPVAVIPHAVVIPEGIENITCDCSVPRIGYLGRIHPRKNVDRLIRIWRERKPSAELVIAGSGDPAYVDALKALATGDERIRFLGFLSGGPKLEMLGSLRALAVPSDFENFGMIVPEALSMGTPVIASLRTPWEELNSRKCGWRVDNSPRFALRGDLRSIEYCSGNIVRNGRVRQGTGSGTLFVRKGRVADAQSLRVAGERRRSSAVRRPRRSMTFFSITLNLMKK